MVLTAFTPIMHPESYGRMAFEGLAGRGARITVESRCERCGQPFQAGDLMLAHLQEDWDTAPVEHDGPCPKERKTI